MNINPAIFSKKHVPKVLFCFILAVSLFLARTSYAFDYQGLDVSIRGSALEAYDDNITFLDEDRKKDFITDLSAGVGVEYKEKPAV